MSPSSTTVTSTALAGGPRGSLSNGSPGSFGGSAPSGNAKRPLLHIDDVVRVEVKMDNFSIEKILEAAEHSIKMAESLRDFGRLDLALREYLKASIITIQVIPAHRDWVRLRSDNKGKAVRYNALMARINSRGADFDQIKQLIKEDNQRTGVRPASEEHVPGVDLVNAQLANGSRESAPRVNGKGEPTSPAVNNASGQVGGAGTARASGDHDETTSPKSRPRPVVQPKPQALHGKSLKPVVANAAAGSKTTADLAERFAKLRSAKDASTPDPRTQQARPSGPRGMPGAPSHISMPHALPDMPKLPDAIYSPERPSVSSDFGQAPLTSTPRAVYSRTNSIASLSNGAKAPSTGDYFNSGHVGGRDPTSKAAIPPGDDICAQDLAQLMKDVKVLIIDARPREDYDEGHIMTQSTVCIDHEVLRRNNISASEIQDSMVVGPSSEHRLFEWRHDFPAIVIHDEASEEVKQRPETQVEVVLSNLWNALKHYDYPPLDSTAKPRSLKLLKGGIEAWKDVAGPNSLQATPLVAREVTRSKPMGPRPWPRRNATRPIQDLEEAKRWEEESNKDMKSSAIVRSTDDFLRRFPPISSIQESMTSPVQENDSPRHSFSSTHQFNAYSKLPSAPARPPPAVPRQSHSDTLAREDEDRYVSIKRSTAGVGKQRRNQVGLENSGNLCYANSTFQALFGSGAFADELVTGQWASNWKVPMKKGEKIMPPQLLTKIMSNLFHWMQDARMQSMRAKTLMDYCYHIHSKDSSGKRKERGSLIFGDTHQHDAHEFLGFLLVELDDETNRRRDKDPIAYAKEKEEKNKNAPPPPKLSASESAVEYWNERKELNDSIIDKYWSSLEAEITHCTLCGHDRYVHVKLDIISLPIPPNSGHKTNLTALLNHYSHPERLEDYKCDGCGERHHCEKTALFAHMPDVFPIHIARFQAHYDKGQFTKDNIPVEFPISGLDLTPYSVQAYDEQQHRNSGNSAPPPPPPKIRNPGGSAPGADALPFTPPFIYDCHAVIVHSGSLSQGHYRAYVRDEDSEDPFAWHHFNDEKFTPVRVGSQDQHDVLQQLYKDRNRGGSTAYMLFYKRRKH